MLVLTSETGEAVGFHLGRKCISSFIEAAEEEVLDARRTDHNIGTLPRVFIGPYSDNEDLHSRAYMEPSELECDQIILNC